jgi:DNA-binding response OmpR family regulator
MKPKILEIQIQRGQMAAARRTVLLVSNDAGVGERLGSAADRADLAFWQTTDSANAHRLAVQNHPAVVFLDLDFPALSGWDAAERFLENERCPPLILLSGRTSRLDMEAAICGGTITDKSASPDQLLEKVNGALTEPDAERVNRHARQRLLISWLRPFHWTIPVTPAVRHWGINE